MHNSINIYLSFCQDCDYAISFSFYHHILPHHDLSPMLMGEDHIHRQRPHEAPEDLEAGLHRDTRLHHVPRTRAEDHTQHRQPHRAPEVLVAGLHNGIPHLHDRRTRAEGHHGPLVLPCRIQGGVCHSYCQDPFLFLLPFLAQDPLRFEVVASRDHTSQP